MTTIVSFNFNNSALYIKPEQTLTRLWSASVYNAPPLDVALSFLTVLKTGKLSRRLGLRSVSCRHITLYFTVLPARCRFSSSKWANKPRQFHWSTAITLSLSVLCTDITLIDRINVSNKAMQEQEAQLLLTNRAMPVCKVVEVWQDFLSEYVDKLRSSRTYATDG